MRTRSHRIAMAAGAVCLGLACTACAAATAAPQPQRQPELGAAVPALPPAPVVSRVEAFPESSSYVGGFFIDPLSAALRATGLGLLLSGDWARGPHRFNR